MIDFENLVSSPVTLTHGNDYYTIPQTAEQYITLPAQDYTQTDVLGDLLNPTPVIRITSGETASKIVDIPLNYTNMLPLHTYTYKITINAVHVLASAHIAPSDDNQGVDGSIESIPFIPLGKFTVEEWQTGGGGEDVVQ